MFYIGYVMYLFSILTLHSMLFILHYIHLDASLLSLVFGNWIWMLCHKYNIEHLMFFLIDFMIVNDRLSHNWFVFLVFRII